jgi:hypothetical protein
MRISTALAPLTAVAGAAASNAAAHALVLIVAMVLTTQTALLVLFVCLPAARRKDLLKLVRAVRRPR